MKVLTAVLILFTLTVSWYYAASYWSATERGIPVEFYPFWNASRAILIHENPYGFEVTQQNQIAAYGRPSRTMDIDNQQRFAYPVSATLPLLPLGLIPFSAANNIVFVLFSILTGLAVGWLRKSWDQTTFLYSVLTFSAYPVIYDLKSRQPTVFFFGLAVVGLAMVRSQRQVVAAVFAALSLGKPHLGLSVLLAELVWSLARWHERKRFIFSLLLSLLIIFAVSSLVCPGWVLEWIATLRAYSQYNQPSLVISLFGGKIGSVVVALLLVALVTVLWFFRESDLLLQAALSVSVVSFLIPYANYNAIMLLIPTTWIMDNAIFLINSGEFDQFMLSVARVVVILFLGSNVLGAILLHTSRVGKLIGWMLPSMVTHALLFCLTGVLAAHYYCLFINSHPRIPSTYNGEL